MKNAIDTSVSFFHGSSKLSLMYTILNDYPFTCFPFCPNLGRAVTFPNKTGGVVKISGWDVFNFPTEPNDDEQDHENG